MSKKTFILIALFLSLFSTGYSDTSIPSINSLMSIEDQQKTGVIKLSQIQKMELAKWLVTHGYPPSTPKAKTTSHLPFSIYYSYNSNSKQSQKIIKMMASMHRNTQARSPLCVL